MRHHQITKQTFKIITQYGDMLVVKQGIQHHHQNHHHHHHPLNGPSGSGQQGGGGGGSQKQTQQNEQQQQSTLAQPSRPIIMTFHDLGLNSELQFATFCECDEVKLMLQTFTMIHVNFIGQEFDNQGQTAAQSLPDDFKYPTVEQMAECIVDICAQLRVRSFVALAVGAGAHIVSTLALIRPDLVHGLFLINPVVSSCSITEWLYFKMSAIASNRQLLGGGPGHHHHHHHLTHSQGQQSGSGAVSLAGSVASSATDETHHHHSPDHHHHQHQDKHHHQQQQRPSPTGLRRLWNAVHHHHHHHNQQQQHQSGGSSKSGSISIDSQQAKQDEPERVPAQAQVGAASGGGGIEEQSPSLASGDSRHHRPHSPSTSSSIGSSHSLAHHHKPAASGRLRHLILSRNFRLGKHSSHHHHHQSHRGESDGDHGSMTGLSMDSRGHLNDDGDLADRNGPGPTSLLDESDESALGLPQRRSSCSSHQPTSSNYRRLSSSSQASSSTSASGKRAPLEYLMYHHFGSVSFQRLRRLSSDAQTEMFEQAGRFASTSATKSPTAKAGTGSGGAITGQAVITSPQQAEDEQKLRNELAQYDHGHRASCDSATSNKSGGNGSSSGGGGRQQTTLGAATESLSGNAGSRQMDRSQESLCNKPQQHRRQRLQRSSSVCLSATYLASIASDRQRVNYMQMVYKQYFTQVNSHNLWLFAQSFVKRKTLSLRKDCGAAAHAAAAAAALGTSICVAFVGLGPVGATGGGSYAGGGAPPKARVDARETTGEVVSTSTPGDERGATSAALPAQKGSATTKEQQHSTTGPTSTVSTTTTTTTTTSASSSTSTPVTTSAKSAPASAKEQQALVAGTKVKRTFTCQTLIMCSSVHIHRDRALKLMSLLNPLQATWIKTDQLLVLEEKPEKVCQALRLFLQGIGYSMSTYERRLRLCSAQASASSADSNGSGPSSSLESSSMLQPQQQQERPGKMST